MNSIFNFEYIENIKVLNIDDLLIQLKEQFGEDYILMKECFGKETVYFVTSYKNIKEINFIGDELIYFKIIFNDRPHFNISKEMYYNQKELIEIELIEETLVCLSFGFLDNLNFNDYFIHKVKKVKEVNLNNDYTWLVSKLGEYFRSKIDSINNYSYLEYEMVYKNGDVKIYLNNKTLKTNENSIYSQKNLYFVKINNEVIILKKDKRI